MKPTKPRFLPRTGLFYALFLCLLAFNFRAANAQNPEQAFPLQFQHTQYDFGTIGEKGGEVYHAFEFQNLTNDTIWIQSAAATCHCTTGEFPKGAIPPKGKGVVTVKYNPLGRPWEFESAVEVKVKGHKTGQELQVKGKTIGGAETIRFEPAEFVQKFEYNEKSIEAHEKAFQAFVEKMVPLIEKHKNIKIQIESSASHVPTKTFANNTELTKQRARDARAKMLDILARFKADLSRVDFLDDVTLVQGPAYSSDYKKQMAKYLPFQYVKIRVF